MGAENIGFQKGCVFCNINITNVKTTFLDGASFFNVLIHNGSIVILTYM